VPWRAAVGYALPHRLVGNVERLLKVVDGVIGRLGTEKADKPNSHRHSHELGRDTHRTRAKALSLNAPLLYVETLENGLRGCDLYTGRDERIVRRVAIATRCRTLGRKSGCIPGGAAICHEQDFIIIALTCAGRCIAV
jgi:hypothetical protein